MNLPYGNAEKMIKELDAYDLVKHVCTQTNTNFDKICNIRVEWNLRAECRFGQACYNDRSINLTSAYLLIPELRKEWRDTFLHEIAHFIAFDRYYHNGHGGTWSAVMIMLGLEPKRCKEYYNVTHMAKAANSRKENKQ